LPALEGAAQIAYATRSPAAPDLLHRILLQRPEDQTSHAMLGSLSFQHGDCPAAIDHFDHSLALVQKSVEAQRELGACLLGAGRTSKGRRSISPHCRARPEREESAAARICAMEVERFRCALAHLQPLLTSSATGSKPFSLAAQIAEEKGDTPRAVEWLRTAIVKDPADTANYLLFATISFNHASYQVGIDVVDSGIQQSPDAAKLYLARGVLQVQLSQLRPGPCRFSRKRMLSILSFPSSKMPWA
jgi:predicted Zn-dependent protease